MDRNLVDVLESVAYIKDKMLTKDDAHDIVRAETHPRFDAIDDQLTTIQRELVVIPRRLDTLDRGSVQQSQRRHQRDR